MLGASMFVYQHGFLGMFASMLCSTARLTVRACYSTAAVSTPCRVHKSPKKHLLLAALLPAAVTLARRPTLRFRTRCM
jgi:hypothetical protein